MSEPVQKGKPRGRNGGRTAVKLDAKPVEYYLSQAARDLVAEYAIRDGVSRSEVVERMIRYYHETPRII